MSEHANAVRARALAIWRAWYRDVTEAGHLPRLSVMQERMAQAYELASEELAERPQ